MRKNKPNKNYQSKNHSKFILTYHIIFTCKYRKKLLIKYGEDIKQIMFEVGNFCNETRNNLMQYYKTQKQ